MELLPPYTRSECCCRCVTAILPCALPMQGMGDWGSHPEAKDRQYEGVAGVIGEQVICPEQALLQGSPQKVALAAHP